jgi:hypothetical protein
MNVNVKCVWLSTKYEIPEMIKSGAVEVAIARKDLIEKLVLIDPSGTLNGPTPLLRLYWLLQWKRNLY